MTFRKQERIKGRLLPEQTYEIKVRHRPFAIYMKSVLPVSGASSSSPRGSTTIT